MRMKSGKNERGEADGAFGKDGTCGTYGTRGLRVMEDPYVESVSLYRVGEFSGGAAQAGAVGAVHGVADRVGHARPFESEAGLSLE